MAVAPHTIAHPLVKNLATMNNPEPYNFVKRKDPGEAMNSFRNKIKYGIVSEF